MLTNLRWKLSYANIAATFAVFIALSTGTAYAAGYVISSNKQVAPNTISGHLPPAGEQANLVPGSITAADLATAEAWHSVAANSGDQNNDPCNLNNAIFCGTAAGAYWHNAGGQFAAGAFFKDPLGAVHLRGLVTRESGADRFAVDYVPVFYLPRGYQPAHELVFTTLDNDVNGSYLVRVDVTPSGGVQVINHEEPPYYPSGAHKIQFLSLDGIAFQAGE